MNILTHKASGVDFCFMHKSCKESGHALHDEKREKGMYQLVAKAVCAASGELASAIPNPPAIKAPIIARNLRI
jgi:hypothetical protein